MKTLLLFILIFIVSVSCFIGDYEQLKRTVNQTV